MITPFYVNEEKNKLFFISTNFNEITRAKDRLRRFTCGEQPSRLSFLCLRPESRSPPLFQALLLLLSLIIVAAFFSFSITGNINSVLARKNAVLCYILNKQSMTFLEGPHEDGMQYWIYVQPLKGGPKREFSVEPHYDALSPVIAAP